VEQFRRNAEQYRDPRYNETQVRREFIDPLFEALGWDVNNTEGFDQFFREVVHEDSIKVGGAAKAPDYSFRLGGSRILLRRLVSRQSRLMAGAVTRTCITNKNLYTLMPRGPEGLQYVLGLLNSLLISRL